jgi:hypothetical protein
MNEIFIKGVFIHLRCIKGVCFFIKGVCIFIYGVCINGVCINQVLYERDLYQCVCINVLCISAILYQRGSSDGSCQSAPRCKVWLAFAPGRPPRRCHFINNSTTFHHLLFHSTLPPCTGQVSLGPPAVISSRSLTALIWMTKWI